MATPTNSADLNRDGPAIQERIRLDRSLGFGQLTASGVGIIIGAGIYVLVGSATAKAGDAVWISFGLAADYLDAHGAELDGAATTSTTLVAITAASRVC